MNTGRRIFYYLFLIIIGMTLSFKVLAFSCGNSGQVIVDVDPAVFKTQPVVFSTKPGANLVNYGTGGMSSSQTGVPAAPSGSGFYCALSYMYGDRVAITAIDSIHAGIAATDYTSKINVGSTGIPGSPGSANYTFSNVSSGGGACLLCGSTSNNNWYRVNTPPITVTLTRTAGWQAKPINNGETLFRLTVRRTDSSAAVGTIVFRMSGTVTYPTCNITNPGNRTVNLPPVKKSDLQSAGTGRYSAVKADFTFNLDCEADTKVKVKFEGDKLTGEDYALKNTAPGGKNTAVGIQIVERSTTTAMKIDETVTVLSPAATGENILNFDAYYFKGASGTIDGGPIRASATYTFTYE